MNITDADIVWTPNYKTNDALNRGAVRVEEHRSGWTRTPGDMWMPATSLGAFGSASTRHDPTKKLLAMFILFNTLVVRDGIDPGKAHAAFLKID